MNRSPLVLGPDAALQQLQPQDTLACAPTRDEFERLLLATRLIAEHLTRVGIETPREATAILKSL